MSVRRAAIWSASGQYATFAIQFATSVIISRFFLLPADLGLFSIALASAMIVSIFQDMGITRFVSGQPEMRPDSLPHYAAVAVGIGWSVALVVAIAAPFVAHFYGEPALASLLWVIAGSYLIAPFAIVPAAMLIRAMNFRALFRVNAGSALAGSAVAIALATQGFGAAALAWGVLATAVTRATIALSLQPIFPRRPPSWGAIRPMLGFSSSSLVLSISAAIGQRSQDLIVGRLLGMAATGLFSRAGALAGQLSTLVTGAINSVFYPAFAKKRDAGEPLAPPYLHLVACNTALNWAAMVGLALAAEPVVQLLYGPNWSETAHLLRWMALAEIFFVAVPLQMDIPILLGRIKPLIWVNLADTMVAIVVLTLGCIYGLEAAAMSRIVYGFIWWGIYSSYQSRLLRFPFHTLLAIYARSAVCALAAGAPLLIAGHYGWGGTHLGFFGLLLLSGLGVLTWLAAAELIRHPVTQEIHLAFGSILAAFKARVTR